MAEPRQNARTAGVREGGSLRITWVKSAIGYNQDQKDTIKSLGLRRLNHVVEVADSASIRGMIFKVKHLVSFEEV
ncbi:MAG TPA: 50S ribosomal protein L30 [Chloroflexia bacterium]|nr:50S ribosomal protein L30 [Chloroflexia bacterium]